MEDDDPPTKKTNIEPSGKYDVIASEYFYDDLFFEDNEEKDSFMRKVKKFKPNEGEPIVVDLKALSVEQFYKKAFELCNEDDDKLKYFFLKNIKVCKDQVVLNNYHQWRKEAGMQIPDRMVSVGFKIQDTELSHTVDLDCFSERVVELFGWWDQKDDDPRKLVGPYLCFVQSSGMGKTKLMYEYRNLNKPPDESEDKPPDKNEDNTTQNVDKVVALLILPTNIDLGKKVEQPQELFDYQLALDVEIKRISPSAEDAAKQAAEKVYEKLDAISTKFKDHKKIVLLFDECHKLLEKKFTLEAFLFRCIRVWLREKRPMRVVAVFAGTNSRLNNFLVESDSNLERGDAPSRVHELAKSGYEDKGSRFNPPFFQTTTIGSCLALMPQENAFSEYARSVYYGRPLFAVMASPNDGILDKNLSMVLSRMLLSSIDGKKWEDNRNVWINLLSTRVQMGQTTMSVTSDLVAKAYANLCGYFEQTEAAQLAYLPDPVCARLSMCMMDEEFTFKLPGTNTSVTGKNKEWWTEQLQTIFSSGIVSPEKGDFGEVIVALYMLFCSDLLRKKKNEQVKDIGNDENYMIQNAYTHFSVSLDEFLLRLQLGGKEPPVSLETGTPCKASVGFIQVCRNSLRSYCDSWEALADQDFLKYVYESGTAFYVCHGCPVIDMVIPLRIETDAEPEFIPMFVSIKCHSSFGAKSAFDECNQMEKRAKTYKVKKAFCLLVVFGCESRPSPKKNKHFDQVTDIKDISDGVAKGLVAKAIFVPKDDQFGLSRAFKSLTPSAQVYGELLTSHPFIKAHGDKTFRGLGPSKATRSSSKYRKLWKLYKSLRKALFGRNPEDMHNMQT